jgi:hypothetical protein
MFVRYAFLADTVSTDAIGKISAIGIFDNIMARNFPTVHRDMTLVVNLEGTTSERGDHKISVEIRDSDANRLIAIDQPITLGNPAITHGTLRHGVIVKMQDIPFQRQGQYEFVVFGDDRFLVRVPFMVQKITVKEAGDA